MKAMYMIIVLASVFCADGICEAVNSRKEISANIVAHSAARSMKAADSIKIGRTSYCVPAESRDTGYYGLHLQLSMNKTNYAQTGIYFYNNASDKYVQNEDTQQLNAPGATVFLSSFSSDGVDLCINTMSDYAKGKQIRLYVNTVYGGLYSLSLADVAGIDTANYLLLVVDRLRNDTVNLVTSTYSFNITLSDTTTYGGNRFVLEITHKPVAPYKLATFSGQKAAQGVEISWRADNAGNYTGYVLQKLNPSGGYDSLYAMQSSPAISKYDYTDNHPATGNNVYRLEQNGINGAITYSPPITIGYNSQAPNIFMNIYPNPASAAMTVSIPSPSTNSTTYIANTYDLSGTRVNHQVVTGATWLNDVSSFRNGLYIIQVTDSQGNFIGQAKFIKRN